MQNTNHATSKGFVYEDGRTRLGLILLASLFISVSSCFAFVALFTSLLIISPYIYMVSSVCLTLLGIWLCIKLSGTAKPIIPFCVICGLIMFFLPDAALAASLCSFIISGALSALLLKQKKAAFFIVSAIIGTALCFIITKSIILSLISLLILPFSFALYMAYKKGEMRVGTILRMSCATLAPMLVILLAWVFITDKEISINALSEFADTLRVGIIEASSRVFREALEEMGSDSGINVNIQNVSSLIELAVNTAFNMLPAILSLIFFVISYITHSLFLSLLSGCGEEPEKIRKALTFKMSVTSAVVFLIALIAFAILSENGGSTYCTAAQNVYVMLFPGLSLVAFGFVGALTRQNASCLGTIVYVAIFALLIFNPSIAALVFSLSGLAGALIVIFAEIRTAIDKKKKD